MEFKSGAPFSWESLHTDGIVVDEETAWQLFGSNDVEGMQVMIGQVPHFITGVIEKEAGKMIHSAHKLHTMIPDSVLEIKKKKFHGEFSINDAEEYAKKMRAAIASEEQ